MVDALRQTHLALVPGGRLIDLRPTSSPNTPLEIVTSETAVEVGQIDTSADLRDDLASDRAIATMVHAGSFASSTERRFEFEFAWDSVAEMADYLRGRRPRRVTPSFERLDEMHRQWTTKVDGPVRIRYRRSMIIDTYRKIPVGVSNRAAPRGRSCAPGRKP